MKKEWFAIALLAVIFAGSFWNLRHLSELTEGLLQLTETSFRAADEEDWAIAASAAEAAEKRWTDADPYTHIFIRHPEIDAVTDAFCSYRGAVTGREPGELFGTYLSLCEHLRSLRGMEQLSFGSIF